MVGPEPLQSPEPVDILGDLANSAASRLSKQRTQRQRTGRAACALGKRISAAELRARGVDEAFLAPAACVDAAPVLQESLSTGSRVTFVASEVYREQASDQSGPSADHAFNLAGSTDHCRQEEANGSRVNSERHWSSAELDAEYGIGYKLLAGMGYQAGVGRVPLTAVKRLHRAALQDDEAAVLDDSFTTKKRPRRVRAHCRAPKRRPLQSSSGSLAEDAAAAVETLWAQEAKYEGVSSELEDGFEHGDTEDDISSGSNDEDTESLRSIILAEVRQRAGEHISLAVLASCSRMRRALADRPESGKQLHSYIRSYIQEHVHECQVRRSLAPGWLKLSGSGSMTSWGAVTRKQFVVALRNSGDDDNQEGGRRWQCWESSSDEEHVSSNMNTPLDQIPALQPSKAQTWFCHSCKQTFSHKVALREHLQERLIARTTWDPTDLTAPLDAEHMDREALQLAAKVSRQKQAPLQQSAGEDTTALWHCPACSWTGPADEVSTLLAHACSAPGQRVTHQRLLAVVAELLIAEPPLPLPLPDSAKRAAVFRAAPDRRLICRLESWAASASGFAQLFNSLASSSSEGYRQLEAEILGPLEDDIFNPSAHQEFQSCEPQIEEQGIFV